MAYCRNCGNEIVDGVKFCGSCGSQVGTELNEKVENTNLLVKKRKYNVAPNTGNNMNTITPKVSVMDKIGKFFGIILLILVFVNFQIEIPLLTIIVSIGIIAGALFCLIKKYKLRFFTILALVLAVCCLLGGINDAKSKGILGNRNSKKNVVKDIDDSKEYSDKNESKNERNNEDIIEKVEELEENINKVEEIADEADSASENIMTQEDTKEETNVQAGVDPELKAFLDSYEAFMDEYVDFMKKYQSDPGNAISMMSDYMTILTRYEEFALKADSYNQNDMSKEDLEYYLDSLNRIEKKMLEIL